MSHTTAGKSNWLTYFIDDAVVGVPVVGGPPDALDEAQLGKGDDDGYVFPDGDLGGCGALARDERPVTEVRVEGGHVDTLGVQVPGVMQRHDLGREGRGWKVLKQRLQTEP